MEFGEKFMLKIIVLRNLRKSIIGNLRLSVIIVIRWVMLGQCVLGGIVLFVGSLDILLRNVLLLMLCLWKSKNILNKQKLKLPLLLLCPKESTLNTKKKNKNP